MTDQRLAGKRITIVIPNELHEKLRQLQAQLIPKSDKSISFSNVLSACADVGIKNIAQCKEKITKSAND